MLEQIFWSHVVNAYSANPICWLFLHSHCACFITTPNKDFIIYCICALWHCFKTTKLFMVQFDIGDFHPKNTQYIFLFPNDIYFDENSRLSLFWATQPYETITPLFTYHSEYGPEQTLFITIVKSHCVSTHGAGAPGLPQSEGQAP